MKKITTVLLCLLIGSQLLFSQDIEITNVFIDKGKVELRYNILDERIDRTYTINLYTSKDNFIQPMKHVVGEVGIDIAVGNNKRLIWDAKKEFGSDFDGDISLELKGNYYIPFISIAGIEEGREFKRGKKYDIAWSGGRGDNILNFELYQQGNLVKSFEERANTGKTEIVIPQNVKPGANYQFKITDANNSDEVVFTEKFIIKRKFPLFLQVGVGVLVSAATTYLIIALQPEEEFEVPLPDTPDR